MEADPGSLARQRGDFSLLTLGSWVGNSVLLALIFAGHPATFSPDRVILATLGGGVLAAFTTPFLALLCFRERASILTDSTAVAMAWVPITCLLSGVAELALTKSGLQLPDTGAVTLIHPRAALHVTLAGLTLLGLSVGCYFVRTKLTSAP